MEGEKNVERRVGWKENEKLREGLDGRRMKS